MIKVPKNLDIESSSTGHQKPDSLGLFWTEIIPKYEKLRFSPFFAYSGGILKKTEKKE